MENPHSTQLYPIGQEGLEAVGGTAVDVAMFVTCRLTNSPYPHYFVVVRLAEPPGSPHRYLRFDRFVDKDRKYRSGEYGAIMTGLKTCDLTSPLRIIDTLTLPERFELRRLAGLVQQVQNEHAFDYVHSCFWCARKVWDRTVEAAGIHKDISCWRFNPANGDPWKT